MHTLWQRKVIGALSRTFPNIQFIVTAHSPQILGEIDERFNVVSLTDDDNSAAGEMKKRPNIEKVLKGAKYESEF